MLKIDLSSRGMAQLDEKTMQSEGMKERYDLQDLIVKNPEEFFKELDEELFLIGSEISPTEKVADRIDLLALDSEGDSVIIELKRDKHKLHLLQAIPYAGMVARWKPNQFLEALTTERRKALTDFLEDSGIALEDINQDQRIVLLAEAFDWEVLITAEWLSQKFDVDISCVQLSIAVDGGSRYLSCTQLYPQPDLEDYAPSRGGQRAAANPQGWDALLDTFKNPDLVAFVKEWRNRGDKALLQCERLEFPSHRSKWRVNLSKSSARVMQGGRFKLADGVTDEEYWKKGLSDPQSVQVHRGGIRLHFTLVSKSDFDFFRKSIVGPLKDIQLKQAAPN